jgi:hypothetical protein
MSTDSQASQMIILSYGDFEAFWVKGVDTVHNLSPKSKLKLDLGI